MDLEGVGVLAAEHAGLEDGLGRGAGATGDRLALDLHLGVLRFEELDQGLEGGALVARPPVEDLELARGGHGQAGRDQDC